MVPFCDVGVDGVDELAQRPKGSSPDGLSSDDAEPGLHLVEPGAVGRGEVEGDVRVFGESLIDLEPGTSITLSSKSGSGESLNVP
jgi:hypothetical protein